MGSVSLGDREFMENVTSLLSSPGGEVISK